jgi:glutamate--cysteine ligase
MSLDLDHPEARPIGSSSELVESLRRAERKEEQLQLGLEHEKLLFPRGTGGPVPYEGERGVGALIERLAQRGYTPYRESEKDPPIALMKGALTVSLEPGGQFELSGSPHRTARAAHQENVEHMEQVREACDALGLVPVGLGYRPFGTPAQMPWMPKHRYQSMREVLPRRGRYALDMMLMTATGQVSLDWTDEADCVRKTEVAVRVAPLLIALYANSPVVDGRRSEFLTFRSQVWTDVDPARCGVPSSMLDGSFSYQAYVDWALDVPLLFLRRQGRYLTPKLTFRQLLAEGFDGQPATDSDWNDHLSALFPEVRLKKVIEIRGADCVSLPLTGALGALWRGLFYDRTALEDAGRLVGRLTPNEYAAFQDQARRRGLRGEHQGTSLGALSTELVEIARAGLRRIDPQDAPLLDPLLEVAQSGRSPAEEVLEVFEARKDPAAFVETFAL